MKLYYAAQSKLRAPENFGDVLNLWLWDKLIPGILDNDERVAFVAIGTLINQKLLQKTPNALHRVVFSSGVGYGKPLTQIDETYTVYCVRGPLSAKALGLSADMAVTDGAVLIRRVFQPALKKKYRFAYMPHYNFAGDGWKLACESIDFAYIDPRYSVEAVLSLICQTEVLLTEAMHGAIIADALRVPWVPVVSHSDILSFKWHDWCESVGLNYQPFHIERLHHPRQKIDLLTPLRRLRDWKRQRYGAQQLKQVAQESRPVLSDEIRLEQLIVELESRLAKFKTDVSLGRFVK